MPEFVSVNHLVELIIDKASTGKDADKPYIGLEHIESGTGRIIGYERAGNSKGSNGVFSESDILFGKLRPRLKKCCIAPYNGYCSTDILILRAKDGFEPRFVYRALSSENIFSHAIKFEEGTKMPRTSWKKLSSAMVWHPRVTEQRVISDILDTADENIRQTEIVIAKLQKLKLGLLQDLLTRGIDENGELRDPARYPEQFKDSPLGRIPKEWNVTALENVAKVNSGVTLGKNIQGSGTIELPYLRVANVQDGYLDLTEIKRIRIFEKDVEKYSLKKGDVLMNEGGDYDKLGRGAVWEGQIEPCLHQNHVFRVRPFSEIMDSYFLDAVSGSQYGKNYFIRIILAL